MLGEDLTNTAPMLDFSVRRWARLRPTAAEERLGIARWNDAGVGAVKKEERSALWIAATHAGKLDEIAAEAYHGAPDDLVRFTLALAAALKPKGGRRAAKGLTADEAGRVERYAAALRAAERPVVISGVSCGSVALLEAAAALARALPGPPPAAAAPLALVVPEVNTLGLMLLGGRRLSEAFGLAAEGDVEVALVIENDLYRRAPAAQVAAFLQACGTAIVVDHVETATTAAAAAVLPAASWAETTGTFVSHEGSAQRSVQVMAAPRPVQPTWRWLSALAAAARLPVGQDWLTLDHVLDELARERPDLAPATLAAPPADARFAGMKIPRQPTRASGRTAMHADVSVFDPAPPDDRDSAHELLDGGLPRAAAVASDRALPRAALELGAGAQQVPGGGRRAAARRRSRRAARRAARRARPAAARRHGRRRAFRPAPDRLLAVPLPPHLRLRGAQHALAAGRRPRAGALPRPRARATPSGSAPARGRRSRCCCTAPASCA